MSESKDNKGPLALPGLGQNDLVLLAAIQLYSNAPNSHVSSACFSVAYNS